MEKFLLENDNEVFESLGTKNDEPVKHKPGMSNRKFYYESYVRKVLSDDEKHFDSIMKEYKSFYDDYMETKKYPDMPVIATKPPVAEPPKEESKENETKEETAEEKKEELKEVEEKKEEVPIQFYDEKFYDENINDDSIFEEKFYREDEKGFKRFVWSGCDAYISLT